jgi:poly(3-hydroxyoctanoate) depolymerase
MQRAPAHFGSHFRSALTRFLPALCVAVLVFGCGTDVTPLPLPAVSAATDGGAVPDSATVDAQAPGVADGSADAAPLTSLCSETPTNINCPFTTTALSVPGSVNRNVHYATPRGPAPAAGYPVAILYQGSFVPAVKYFAGQQGDKFGGYQQALVVKRLLDAGYMVLAPDAPGNGSTFWQTNVAPWNVAWDNSPDDKFVRSILAELEGGRFGQANMSRLYAAGLSSGGYMASRMAISYPGRFRAIAIMAASYATCSAALCAVPDGLSAAHAPTLFLHGEKDDVVPIGTSRLYSSKLIAARVDTAFRNDPNAGHEWIAAAPDAVRDWFAAH